MKRKINSFNSFIIQNQFGNMLIELLLSIALAVLIIPFIFDYHKTAIIQAENVAITKQMTNIQNILERYIVENREELLRTVGKNITRVNVADLYDYGLAPTVMQNTEK